MINQRRVSSLIVALLLSFVSLNLFASENEKARQDLEFSKGYALGQMAFGMAFVGVAPKHALQAWGDCVQTGYEKAKREHRILPLPAGVVGGAFMGAFLGAAEIVYGVSQTWQGGRSYWQANRELRRLRD